MTLHTALRTLGWLAGTLFPQQALRVLQGRDFNAALGRVDDALAVTEEQVEVWEPAQPSLDSLLEAYWWAKTPEVETQALEDLRRYYPDGDWKLQPKSPKWLCDLVDSEEARATEALRAAGLPSDFPDCTCPARRAADLDDHRPACAARAADSPAADERIPDQRPAAGRTRDPGVFDRDAYMAGLTWPEPKHVAEPEIVAWGMVSLMGWMQKNRRTDVQVDCGQCLKFAGDYREFAVHLLTCDLANSRCSIGHRTFSWRCTKPRGHNGDHGESGCFWGDDAATQVIIPADKRIAERLDGAK